MRNIANVDGVAAHVLDRQIVQFRDTLRTGVHVDVIFQGADFRGAGGQNQILRADRVHHIERRESLGLQGGRVQVHLYLALLSAVGIRDGCTRHGDQARADEINARIEQLLLREFVARERQLENRNRRSTVGDDQWRCSARWQLPKLGL